MCQFCLDQLASSLSLSSVFLSSLLLRVHAMTSLNIAASVALVAVVGAAHAPPEGWATCGGLEAQLDNVACPTATATCCTQQWSPSTGNWGCIDWVNATCCKNGYTACPSGYTCKDAGSSWSTVTTCVPTMTGPATVPGKQVCKQGAQMPFSDTLKNVVIIGDSVSIGYTPFVANALAAEALVQHSPWGGDGGAEETAYGDQCLDYLLRAPDGTPLRPDAVMFNWGLHNALSNDTVPGQVRALRARCKQGLLLVASCPCPRPDSFCDCW
jgi:hypothetical protein